MSTSKQLTKKELAFEIHTIEWFQANKEFMSRPSRHTHFEIVWVTKGSGCYSIDLEEYAIADNFVYFVPEGWMQEMRAHGPVRGYVISFNADFLYLSLDTPGKPFFKDVLARFSRGRIVALEGSTAEKMLFNVLKDMVREFNQTQLLQSEALGGLLKMFLIYLHRMSTPVCPELGSSRNVDLFNCFCSKVDEYFLTKRQVAEYAEELSVTPTYLTDVVKRVTGYSASYHIHQRMVLEAKRLAIHSNDNMKLVAYKLGFDDLSHFSKFFKNVAGVNFSEFRRNSYTRGIHHKSRNLSIM